MQKSVVENVLKRYQCTVGEWLIDEGVSATKVPIARRRKLQILFRRMENEKPAFIITYARDRLARNATEHQEIRERALRFGIPIILASNETIYDTGDLVSQLVQDGFTAFEVEQTRGRTRDTVRALTQKGKWFGGRVPYGYGLTKETKELIIVPEQAEVVRRVFNLYEQGHGLSQTAKHPKVGLTKDRVRAIISNPLYAGYVSLRGGRKRKFWTLAKAMIIKKPIISLDEWERCYALLEGKRAREMSPQPFQTPFLLRGLVHCKICGKRLEAKDQRTTSSTGKQYGSRV